MNTKKLGFAVCLIALGLLLTKCASTGFLMAKPKVTLFGDKYPPKDNTEDIDVFFTGKPTSEYIEFAKITCGDTSDKWNLEQIKKKAGEIGADGVIILGKTGTTGVGIPIGNSVYVVDSDYGMTAIAVKYK